MTSFREQLQAYRSWESGIGPETFDEWNALKNLESIVRTWCDEDRDDEDLIGPLIEWIEENGGD